MSVKALQVSVVAGAPVKLVGDDTLNGVSGLIRNITGTATVYVGGADLAAGNPPTNAFRWLTTDAPLSIEVASGDGLWAVLATGGAAQTVEVLAARGLSDSD